jgi:hypothetical protein
MAEETAAPAAAPKLTKVPRTTAVAEDDTLSNLDNVDAPAAPATSKETRNLPTMVDLTVTEFEIARSTIALIQNLRQALIAETETEADRVTFMQQQLRAHEIQIWDRLAKKYGFNSIEDAQEAGISFKLRTGQFIQAYKIEEAPPEAQVLEPPAAGDAEA